MVRPKPRGSAAHGIGRRGLERGLDVIGRLSIVIVRRSRQRREREADCRVRARTALDNADEGQLYDVPRAAFVRVAIHSQLADDVCHLGATANDRLAAAIGAGDARKSVSVNSLGHVWAPPVFPECDPAPNRKNLGRRRIIAPSAVSTCCASTSARLYMRGEAPG